MQTWRKRGRAAIGAAVLLAGSLGYVGGTLGGAAHADTLSTDGDVATPGGSPARFGAGKGAVACVYDAGADTGVAHGVLTVNYDGASHFQAGEPLDVAFFVPNNVNIEASASTTQVPTTWPNKAGSFDIPFTTHLTGAVADGNYQVGVSVTGQTSQYAIGKDEGSGRPQYTVSTSGCGATPSPQSGSVTVTATAVPTFTRTFGWAITKSVDTTGQNVASGASAMFNYTVGVTHDGGTDGGWQVNGTITVSNGTASDITADVTDAIDQEPGVTCAVANGSGVLVAANKSVNLSYTCDFGSAPAAANETDTASASWTGGSAGSSPTSFDWSTPTPIDAAVEVTDSQAGVLGAVTSSDTNPTEFKYSRTFTDPAGTCTSHDNTATFTAGDTGTTGSASKTVKVCVGADLSVAKTAATSFTRTYNWSLTKSVDKTTVKQNGGSVTANYEVDAAETGFVDSAWQVTGDITVTNPNDWEAVTADVADAIDNGGACTVTGGTGVVIAKSGSVKVPYACTYTAAPTSLSGTNTATATWDKTAAYTPDSTANGTASYSFGAPTSTANKTVTVTDTFNGAPTTTLGTLTATDTTPYASAAYKYSHTVNVPQWGCQTIANTATITETNQTAGASFVVCGPAHTGALTMGFWQNKNGQGIITGQAKTGTCPSATWLRGYAPFQDLSSTATCSGVATYVTNTIKASNASGATMNAMLKGQMLATALDVYFSDATLGGTKIAAYNGGVTGPVGAATIDLTQICKMIDNTTTGTATCGGTYENVTTAFGGSTSLTVSQLLAYAASQSNVGGSSWYGQVKATQGLAKDTFDAINNQVAFGA